MKGDYYYWLVILKIIFFWIKDEIIFICKEEKINGENGHSKYKSDGEEGKEPETAAPSKALAKMEKSDKAQEKEGDEPKSAEKPRKVVKEEKGEKEKTRAKKKDDSDSEDDEKRLADLRLPTSSSCVQC